MTRHFKTSIAIASLCLSFSCFGQRLFDANLVLTIPASSSDFAGLVGKWHMNDGSGTSIADSSGNSFTGTFASTPGPSWIWTGLLSFKAGGYVDMGIQTPLLLTNNGTISCWVWMTNAQAASTYMIATSCNLNTDRNGYALKWINTLKLSLELATGAAAQFAAPTMAAMPTDQWVHIASTWNGTTIAFYTNGVSVGTVVQTRIPTYEASTNFCIGAGAGFSGGRLSAGVDDVRIYNTTLSSGDISTLFSNGRQ